MIDFTDESHHPISVLWMAGNRGFDRLVFFLTVVALKLWMAGNRGFDRLIYATAPGYATLWMAGNRGFDRLARSR